jgi:hypothetical protein
MRHSLQFKRRSNVIARDELHEVLDLRSWIPMLFLWRSTGRVSVRYHQVISGDLYIQLSPVT